MHVLSCLLLLALPLHALAVTFPDLDDASRVRGELVSVDFIHRGGQFRTEKGELMDFTMPPHAIMKYRGSESDLRDVPLGAKLTFVLLPDAEGRPSRLMTTEDDQPADETQRKKFIEFTKARGIAGWIDKTEGNLVTVTFFSGDPAKFKETWMTDFTVGKGGGKLCVANDELRTWNPPVDGEGCSFMEVRDVPQDGHGCSGVQLVLKVGNMLEGFRRGRVVRVFGSGWKVQDQFYGESLMGYGFGRMLNQELVENVAKEYPDQFPFRTDFSNAHLPWYQLKSGVKPPPFAEHVVHGELVKVDVVARTGQFRMDRTGEVVDFTLIPGGAVKFLNADAALADIPVGTRCRFHLFQDENGKFTKASLVSDEFSHLAQNFITYRIDALKLDEGKLRVVHQIPEVKDYNGDMKRPPDIARSELRVTGDTRVWKGDKQGKLSDLAVGDVLLVNLTGELPGSPSRCTDLWIGEDTHKLVSGQQAKKRAAAAKLPKP